MADASRPDASSSVDAAALDAPDEVLDAEVQDGALDGSGGDGSAADALAGIVSLMHAPGPGGTTAHLLFGHFTNATLDQLRTGVAPGCTAEESGACRRIECAADALGASHDAGELRAEIGARTVTATVSAPSGQYLTHGDGVVFAPGDVVSFEVTGGAVPAFSAEVVAPDAPAVTLPTTIVRGAPMTLSWGATTAETMQITLVPYAGGGAVSCLVSASDGAVTVDASLLDHLSAGGMVSMAMSAFTTDEIVAGDYAVAVSVAQGSTGTAAVE